MTLNINKLEKEIDDLVYKGMLLECAMVLAVRGKQALKDSFKLEKGQDFQKIFEKIPEFKVAYEQWYSEGLVVIKQLLPDRVDSFIKQYEKPKGRKEIAYDNYVIEDYMIGLQVTRGGTVKVDRSAAIPKLQNQTAILAAVKSRFGSSLFEIRQLVQADLFDSEIDAARELLNNKFFRAAGAVAGVVLERHLAQICMDHNVIITKKHPGISDLNELLKANAIIDVSQWRFISFLGDIRNLCDHNKQQEPVASQVSDLIDGTDKVLKTIS